MANLSDKASLKWKGLCRLKRFTSDQELAAPVPKQFLNSDCIEIISNHCWARLVLNFWASWHRSGSSLGGYLSVSPPNLPEEGCRIWEVNSEIKSWCLKRGTTKSTAFLHPMLSSPSKTLFMWQILLNSWLIGSYLWVVFSKRKFWIIGSLVLQYKSQTFSSP